MMFIIISILYLVGPCSSSAITGCICMYMYMCTHRHSLAVRYNNYDDAVFRTTADTMTQCTHLIYQEWKLTVHCVMISAIIALV